jgi:hypothetical protein
MSAFMRRFAAFLGAEDGIVDAADSATTADSATAADSATTADDADMLDGNDSTDFVKKGEADSVSSIMLQDGAATTEKVATAGFEIGGGPGAIPIPGNFDATTDTPVCVAGPYTPGTDQVALMHISMSFSEAAQQTFTSFPLLSADGGTTWSRAFWGFFAPASNPAGGWALSARADEMELTSGTTYSFAIGYESLGADYAATDSRCHLSVTMVTAGGGGTFGASAGTASAGDN